MSLFITTYLIFGLFNTPAIAEDSETPKYSEEQLQKLKAAEEKYKDNPQVMKIISNIKANSGITDTPVVKEESGPPPITAHGQVITQGSHQQAEQAFRNKDNETAIAHYKVLAAQGDPEASLKLGFIYEQEGDTKSAYAAYKQASESEYNNKDSKLAAERLKWLEKDVMSEEEINQVNQLSEESSQADSDSSANISAKNTATRSVINTSPGQYLPVTPASVTGATAAIKSAVYYRTMAPRVVKITPARISRLQHFKPEKFQRTPRS